MIKTESENCEQLSKLTRVECLPSLVLTVFSKGRPINITLDGGATSNYALHSFCKLMGFKIHPSNQNSILGDQKTILPSVGEIHETFYRDSWSVEFHALVKLLF